MTTADQEYLRGRLGTIRKVDLTNIILAVTGRIGGTGALLAALAEVQNDQSARQARRRQKRRAPHDVGR